jgi:hypothetical protein
MANSQQQIHSRIGDEIEAHCGRCRMDRNHRIVAQDPDGTIRKIICGMCNSYRAYRPPKQTEARVGKPRTPRASAASTPEDFGLPTRNYNMREGYQVGEVIAHPTFGVGKVVSLKDTFKIEVKFSDGLKVLLQNK